LISHATLFAVPWGKLTTPGALPFLMVLASSFDRLPALTSSARWYMAQA
jgi:hypothetical protein